MTGSKPRSCKKPWLLAAGAVAIASPLFAQNGAVAAGASSGSSKPLSYQIVSIKPHLPGQSGRSTQILPDGYAASDISLQDLVMEAYGFDTNPMTDQEVARQPGWFKSERFDVNARVDSSDVPTLQDSMKPKGLAEYIANLQNHVPTIRMLMLQELLADRFHLKVHHEVQQLPVYSLVIAKGGSKLAVSKIEDPTQGNMQAGNGELAVKGMPLILILDSLTEESGRPIIDHTGLTGNYDFTLKWAPEQKQMSSPTNAAGPDIAGPSLFTAVQEQLGLKLEPTKAPVDTIVIDHLEQPSEN
jgi:uncharacterized protein (TIGR03435 family)